MKDDLQKVGGVAALIAAATWVFGFVLFLTVINTADFEFGNLDDPIQSVEFLADNQTIMHINSLIVYVVFGAFLVVLALALNERLKAGSRALVQSATVFGLIWAGLVIAAGMVANIGLGTVVDLYGKDPAQAGSVWLALDSVENGLGGGYEIAGGLWVLLMSWAALRAGVLPRALNYLGVVGGVAGLLTVVPALEMLGAVFGLALIVWFVWLGIVMLRGGTTTSSPVPERTKVGSVTT
jgi:hypothetical protein